MADVARPLAARLNYAQVWEDHRLLAGCLGPAPGSRLLSIASAGDNAIALALAGAEVVALDLSIPQLAITELKLEARRLDYWDYRRLLGIDRCVDRERLYQAVRPHLSARARGFLDGQEKLIQDGIAHWGRFESYLGRFRRQVLPLIHRRSTVMQWFSLADLAAQRRFFVDRWDNLRWRALFRVFFSQRVMAALGRSPEQFAQVHGPIGDALMARTRHVLTEVPIRDNGYVQWMLCGEYLFEEALPPYLTPEGFHELDAVADRIELVHASLEDYLPTVGEDVFDGFNLSNLFEYLSEEQTGRALEGVAAAGRPGARVAYWNLFVPRSRPEWLADRLEPLDALAAKLYAGDRAFVYGAFRVEEVR